MKKIIIHILIFVAVYTCGWFIAHHAGVYKEHRQDLQSIFDRPDWYGAYPILHADWIRECDGTVHRQSRAQKEAL